jgi:hypothetical protein
VTDEPRRSRRGWPDPEPPAPDGDAVVPAHKHSRVPVGIAYVAIVLLLVTDVLLVIGWMDFNDYVHGKGQQRDQENARLNQRINDAICDLLDQLPEGPLLDRPREKYGCGPGIPFDQLPPDIQQQLTPAPAPADDAVRAAAAVPAVTGPRTRGRPATGLPRGVAVTEPAAAALTVDQLDQAVIAAARALADAQQEEPLDPQAIATARQALLDARAARGWPYA